MAEELRLVDWIGKKVKVNLNNEAAVGVDDALIVVEGFLAGIDPMGIIVLFSPTTWAGGEAGHILLPTCPQGLWSIRDGD